MKLTARQRSFLNKLLDLYRERQQPVHYSLVAEKMGVNRFSAYDMLKLLERKGMATSEYVLAAGNVGPGRSMIMFRPTHVATGLSSPLTEARLQEEWYQFKERALQKLREAQSANYRELLNELLARIPERKSPLLFCTDMITALLLNLGQLKDRATDMSPFKALEALGASGEMSLGTLTGLSLGSSLIRPTDGQLAETLLSYTQRFQAHLHTLSEENKTRLSDFLKEALTIFERSNQQG